jgi:hypothetical protein
MTWTQYKRTLSPLKQEIKRFIGGENGKVKKV